MLYQALSTERQAPVCAPMPSQPIMIVSSTILLALQLRKHVCLSNMYVSLGCQSLKEPTFWQTMMKVAVCFDVTRPSPPQKAMSTEYNSQRGVHLSKMTCHCALRLTMNCAALATEHHTNCCTVA